ncbi:MAG: hypothetical protein JSU69_04100 [Candidatus Zixiibacteriota bacterium]|nr:MAG: hypothetical protein JSU69_04100 [candidate division Zixibacteria bacterium]
MKREFDFASRIGNELKRAERYRIFLSLVTFNIGPILDLAGDQALRNEVEKTRFLDGLHRTVQRSVREVDSLSDSGSVKIGLLLPETPRQGAEAAARRISETLHRYCTDYFSQPADYLVPIEISSFPDAAGARSIASYMEDFGSEN